MTLEQHLQNAALWSAGIRKARERLSEDMQKVHQEYDLLDRALHDNIIVGAYLGRIDREELSQAKNRLAELRAQIEDLQIVQRSLPREDERQRAYASQVRNLRDAIMTKGDPKRLASLQAKADHMAAHCSGFAKEV